MARIKIGKKKLLKEKFEVITVSWLVGGVGAFALLSNRYMLKKSKLILKLMF